MGTTALDKPARPASMSMVTFSSDRLPGTYWMAIGMLRIRCTFF
jgi:hypothetical protein